MLTEIAPNHVHKFPLRTEGLGDAEFVYEVLATGDRTANLEGVGLRGADLRSSFTKYLLQAIAPPDIFILQNCDRLFTILKFSLEKTQEIAFAKHSPCEIAPIPLRR
ncbi:hypothetical protein B7O87_09585 [Cylindrospermopsis raciborskii CENA303]|uniref:Uncharacterized protein n=1 Tax=Cylindrospermopsis raciborskii CENA303 TaxID=1170769 RepID=A0A1X4G670_9CYAN|nr:hypothetical protein [Cylindrospermopsis raciborskii]OSO90275.1 hypothetical protein B7O87_09585 [Cylindrospermopsis raciborskii CENA303]